MKSSYDAIIIGGGHNGLTCGCYLAKAGQKVLILEKRHIVGGAAVTEEISPGFRASVYSHVAVVLHPKVVMDLDLKRYGLRSFNSNIDIFRPMEDGRSLTITADVVQTQRNIALFSENDAKRYPEFLEYLSDVTDLIQSLRLQTPIDVVAGDLKSLKRNAAFLWSYRKVGDSFYKLFDLFTISSEELLSRWFESSEVKAALCGVIGGGLMSPRTVGSAWVALYQILATRGYGPKYDGSLVKGQIEGGMGAVTQAMAKCAEEHGAKIEVSSEVASIKTKNDRVTSVVTADGREYTANTVVGNLHAKLLFDKLVGAKYLPDDFMEEIRRFKSQGTAFKLNIACEKPPQFTAYSSKENGIGYSPFSQIAPTLEYLNRACDEAASGWYSSRPYMSVTVPTYLEPSMAPDGKHVVHIYGGHAPYELTEGSWGQERPNFLKIVLDTLDEFAPGFSDGIIDTQLILPKDIESVLSIPGGHINHGDMTVDQMFFRRPATHYSDYRSPIKGLYQCGASTFPGGSVSGLPGHNAAREILRDLGKRPV